MNQSIKLVLSFNGVYMPSTFELAQNFYTGSQSKTYVDSVRRRVHDELREGVEKGLLSRINGKKNPSTGAHVHRYTCRKHADKLGIKSVPYSDGKGSPARTGVIDLINRCIAEMTIDKTYRHKKFTSNVDGVSTVMYFIANSKSAPAQKLRNGNYSNIKQNVLYVVKNHRGVLDDHGVHLNDLVN